MEQWKQIEHKGKLLNYEISSHGNVRHKETQNILKLFDCGNGYLIVKLYVDNVQKKKNFRVHRLVAKAFIPNPHNLTDVDHIDNNKYNNHVSNLQWKSHRNNVIKEQGKRVRCVETGQIYDSIAQVQELTGLDKGTICKVCKGQRMSCGGLHWEYV